MNWILLAYMRLAAFCNSELICMVWLKNYLRLLESNTKHSELFRKFKILSSSLFEFWDC